MFNSFVLDAAVGLVLTYLLLSLVCSSIREMVAGVFKTRAKVLERGIEQMLDDSSLVQALYDHPLVRSLYDGSYETARAAKMKEDNSRPKFSGLTPSKLPSYIPKSNFALALLDLAARGSGEALGAGPLTLDAVRNGLSEIGSDQARRAIQAAIGGAQNDLQRARENLEAWYDSVMDRVSGQYKQRTQLVLFAVAIVVTVIMDADTLRIARNLLRDPAERDVAVAMAGAVGRAGLDTSAAAMTAARQALARVDSLGLPVAWAGVHASFPPTGAELAIIARHAADSFFGWLITAFAIMLGAPFWFDTLNRIMVIRSTVKPKEKSPDEPSKDSPATSVTSTADGKMSGNGVATSTVVPADFYAREWATGVPDEGVL